jgi:hypothetical protein
MINLDQNKKKQDGKKNLDWLAGQPIQHCYKMTKKRPCTQSDLLKKELWNKNLAKKSTNTQKIELRQAPNGCSRVPPIDTSE